MNDVELAAYTERVSKICKHTDFGPKEGVHRDTIPENAYGSPDFECYRDQYEIAFVRFENHPTDGRRHLELINLVKEINAHCEGTTGQLPQQSALDTLIDQGSNAD